MGDRPSDARTAGLAGGKISSVAPASPAAMGGLVAGDRILAVDGAPIQDIIDWQWHASDSSMVLTVARDHESDVAPPHRDQEHETGQSARGVGVTLTREPTTPWGLEFESRLFDGVHTCANSCQFCFVAQLPNGLRSTLYVRDDDYRLSFLDGNFITLTNLSDADVERISEQRISPLYVSLHATDRDVRASLVCSHTDDRALDRFDELLAAEIELHVQIVLVPGVNDGAVLESTLTWLASREGVTSVGVVPVGFTQFGQVSESYDDVRSSTAVLEQIDRWQSAFREEHGIGWVYAADEFYVSSGRELPAASEYDGFPQSENGIGGVRIFADEWSSATATLGERPPHSPDRIVALTGALFAPILQRILTSTPMSREVGVVPVENRFFGGNVSVTGLLTGSDLVDTLLRQEPDALFLLPDVIFNADGVTLDDMSIETMRSLSSRRVRLVSSSAAGLASALLAVMAPFECE